MKVSSGRFIGREIDPVTQKVYRTKVKTVSFWFKKPFKDSYIKVKVCLGPKTAGHWALDWNTPKDWHVEPNDPLWEYTPLAIKPVPSKEYRIHIPRWPIKREVVE